jgi:hypothetical protein
VVAATVGWQMEASKNRDDGGAWMVLTGSSILAQRLNMSPSERWNTIPWVLNPSEDRKISVKMQTRNVCGRNSHNGRVSSQELPEAWNPTDLAVLSDEDGFLHNMDTFCGWGLTS